MHKGVEMVTRKNIFDILKEKYDVKEEIKKISSLFSEKLICFTDPLSFKQRVDNLESFVDAFDFHTWKQRGSCLSCQEMREKLSIDTSSFKTENIIRKLEYYVNIINLLLIRHRLDDGVRFQYSNALPMLLKNIAIILEHLNYEQYEFEKEEMVLLVPKNPAATSVAEISSKETAFAILKYHHASLKGNLSEKRKLLLAIANEYEPLLKKPIDGFTDYFKKVNAMLNNLHVRHNNKEGKNKNNLVANMTNKDLERWYDELYQLLLFCVLSKDNKKRVDEVGVLLKGQ